jgi:putative ABC transport system substrate-binding protein
MPVIGYLNVGSAEASRDRLAAFQQGLSETGFVEGRNVEVEYRWADEFLAIAAPCRLGARTP